MSASKCIEHLAQYRLFRKDLVPLNLVTYLRQTKITRSLSLSDTVGACLGNLFLSASFAKKKMSVSFAFQRTSTHYWQCKIRRLTGFSCRTFTMGFRLRPVPGVFVMDKVALEYVFLLIHQAFPNNIIPSMHNIRLFICHRNCVIFLIVSLMI